MRFDLQTFTQQAAGCAEALLTEATARLRAKLAFAGRIDAGLLEREQRAAHGLAWLATYVEGLRQLGAYAERLGAAGELGELEGLLVRIAAAEYLAHILGGIPM